MTSLKNRIKMDKQECAAFCPACWGQREI